MCPPYLAARRDTGPGRAVAASARILGGFALCVAPWFLWTHLVYGNPSDKGGAIAPPEPAGAF